MNRFLHFAKHLKLTSVLLAVIIVSWGCITTNKDHLEVLEQYTAEMYIIEGQKYLALPSCDNLLRHLNQYPDQFEEERQELLNSYLLREHELICHYRDEGDLFQARHHFYNTLAVRGYEATQTALLTNVFIKDFINAGYLSAARSLKEQMGEEEKAASASSLLEISDFGRMLAEIHVERSWKNEEEILRYDYPTFCGSGFLIDDHHILTAYHVIEQVFQKDTEDFQIFCKFSEEQFNNLTLIAWDSLTDLAVLELPDKIDLPYSVDTLLGDSGTLKQGDTVYALGHPYRYSTTMTRGIISAVDRKAPEVGSWLQIDAVIAPGSSGGFLIGEDRLIYGVVVAGVADEEINFIVPSNVVHSVIDQLKAGKSILRPWLGVILNEKADLETGVEIKTLFPSSPLHEYEIEPGDIITDINGTTVSSVGEAQDLLFYLEAGNVIHLSITKADSESVHYWIRLPRRPDYPIYNATSKFNQLSTLYSSFGFEVDEEKIERKTLKENGETLKLNFYHVAKVDKDSFLNNMGVKQGDLIGFLVDTFLGKSRFITLLHIPAGMELGDLSDIDDYIYSMRQGRHNENIL
jgi:S1-C subfamily serine protease